VLKKFNALPQATPIVELQDMKEQMQEQKADV